MDWDAWFTIAVVVLCFSVLVHNRVPPDVTMTGGLALLLLSGVITTKQALSGFANEGMITVGVLYVVVTGIRETGGIAWIVNKVLGIPNSLKHAQLKTMTPVLVLSAFMNNTPVVAMFIPAVQDWAKRHRLSISKLMIPMSYASIIGGTCTLIGTSTNLVVNGLLIAEGNLPKLALFEIAWVGIPGALIAIPYIILASPRLLPDRVPILTQFSNAREYVIEMLVQADSTLVGKSIEEAGLRQLPGLYLIEVERNGQVIPAVSPREKLYSHDRLLFTGIVESVADLQKTRGLIPATNQVFKIDSPRHEHRLIEAVVSNTCPLVGKNIRQGRFRNVYNAAVVGVARNGERIRQKIGDIILRTGDTLLLVTKPSFVDQQRNSRDFFLVSLVPGTTPINHDRAFIAVAILVMMVLLVTTGLVSMLKAAMLAAGLMIVTGCTRPNIARRAVDWQLLIVIATSFGIGSAMYSTGAAQNIAETLLALSGTEPWVALTLVYLLTALFTAIATNNVAAVLMFPIALATAESLQVNFTSFAITIMMGASASFSTPTGYQTNLMVMGVGGYHFNDFVRMGVPLTILIGIVTVTIAPIVWPF